MFKGAKQFFLLFFSCLALFIMVFPVYVFADSATYGFITDYILTGAGSNIRYRYDYTQYISQYLAITKAYSGYNSTSIITSFPDYRITLLKYNNSTYGFYIVGTDNNVYNFGTLNYGDSSISTSSLTNKSIVSNGTTYYVAAYSMNISNISVTSEPSMNTNGNSPTSDSACDRAVYYTYGSGSIDPEPEINYGLINNLGYHTNIAGSGTAAINNFDVISWDSVTDTLGNTLPEDATINIRVVPGNYSANSKQGLLEKLYSDFILNRTDLVQVASVTASQQSFKIAWRTVVDRLNIPFSSINSLISTDQTWLKYGWIYECQLSIPSAGYSGEWQTVYTSTSSGVENDLIIINNSVAINQELINVMQSINVLNDNDTVWYINDVPVDPDPKYTPPEDDTEEPWYMKILEMIYNSIGVTNEYINEGTTTSKNESDILNSNNNSLNTAVNEYHIVENEVVQEMDNNIQNLNIESDLLSETGFINSARWISEQFTRIITDNPIGLILKFSLILGVALIFLGRFR